MRLPRSLLLALLALAACSDASSGPGPDPDEVEIQLDELVEGEIEGTADLQEYFLDIEEGERFIVLLGVPGDEGIQTNVWDENGAHVTTAIGGRTSSQPIEASDVVTAPRDVRYRIVVQSYEGGAGDYTLEVATVSDAPELRPAAIQLGQVVEGETIAHVADVDAFTFTAAAGAEVVVFIQSMETRREGIAVQLENAANWIWTGFTLAAADGSLDDGALGRVRLPAGGSSTLYIRPAVSDDGRTFVGAYRFRVVGVNAAPETAPVVLAAGDTVAESIEHVGDVDVFTVSGAPGSEWSVFADAGGVPPHAVRVQATMGETLLGAVTATSGGATLLRNTTGRFAIPASGTVTVRVEGIESEGGAYLGPYRLYAHRHDDAPERAAATLPFGQPVSERIDVIGDVDEWTIDVATDTVIHVALTRQPGTFGGTVRAPLVVGGVEVAPGMFIPPASPEVSRASMIAWLHVPAGRHTIRALGDATAGGFEGPYSIEVHRPTLTPESVPATIAAGQAVAGESIDAAGDGDVFRFTLADADTVTATIEPTSDEPLLAYMIVVDPATGVEVRQATTPDGAADPDRRETGRLLLPHAGPWELHVRGGFGTEVPWPVQPYRIALERIGAAPESRPAAIAIGDTVSGERLDVVGDVDDFVFEGTAGQAVALHFAITEPFLSDVGKQAWLIDPRTGAVLGGLGATNGPDVLEDRYVRHIVLPTTGEYIVRVQGTDERIGYGPYTVHVRASP